MANTILRGLGLGTSTQVSGSGASATTYDRSHPVVLDYFNRADAGTPGAARSGQSWSVASGAWSIVSNKIQPTGGGTAIIDAGSADFDVSALVNIAPGETAQAGVLGRSVADTSRIGLFVSGTGSNLNLYVKHGANNYIVQANNNRPELLNASGRNVLRLRGKGAAVTGWLNGTKVIDLTLSSADRTGLNVAGNTFVGMRSGSSTAYTFDDFAASLPV